MGNHMEPAVGVSPLHVGVTLATNRPTWKSTMVATWRAAGCVPAYRDGQVDYGMGRRDTERTGASFLSFFRGRICGKCYFFCGCFVVVDGGGGEFAGLPVYQWILIVWIKCAGFLCSCWCAVPLRWLMISPATCISQHGGYLVSSIFCHRSLQSMIGVIGMRDLFWKPGFSYTFCQYKKHFPLWAVLAAWVQPWAQASPRIAKKLIHSIA